MKCVSHYLHLLFSHMILSHCIIDIYVMEHHGHFGVCDQKPPSNRVKLISNLINYCWCCVCVCISLQRSATLIACHLYKQNDQNRFDAECLIVMWKPVGFNQFQCTNFIFVDKTFPIQIHESTDWFSNGYWIVCTTIHLLAVNWEFRTENTSIMHLQFKCSSFDNKLVRYKWFKSKWIGYGKLITGVEIEVTAIIY